MRVTKWGESGILCSLVLADRYERGEVVGAHEIADSQAIPLQYTQQVLQRLRKGAVVESVRGPNGGYRLAHSPNEITLKDILLAVEGRTFEVICDTKPMQQNCLVENRCGLQKVWRDLKEVVDRFFENQTLAEVLQNHEFVSRGEERPDLFRLEQQAGDSESTERQVENEFGEPSS